MLNTTNFICRGCAQPIWGDYLMALGSPWHPNHFVCAVCSQPIDHASFREQAGKPYHIACYDKYLAPRCDYCGQPLTGEYLVNYWGQKFHKRHEGHYQSCTYCGRLVLPDEQNVHDTVARCPICRASAIETADQARPLFSAVIQWCGTQGLRYNNLPISLDICGPERLATLMHGRHQEHSLGATTSSAYSQNGQLTRVQVDGIAVLRGLPPTLFQGVVAHELGHVWLVVHGIYNLPSWAEEGFCELLSYRYYQSSQTPESQYYMLNTERNPDPTYGEGFRRLQKLSDSIGFPQLLAHLQSTKSLPPLLLA
jgi:hypothetical protein